MKKYFLLVILPAVLFFSCKKDKPGGSTNPPATAIIHTPNLIALSYQPGVPINQFTYHIFDLNHDDNKNKKFFRVKFITGDSAAIVQEPISIDSLAPGWPADVKSVRWGSGAEYIVDDKSFIRGGNVFSKINYNQSSPQHSWLIQWKQTLGIVSGLPNAEVLFNSSNHRLFYFSTGLMSYYTGVTPKPYSLADIGSAAGMGPPFNIYNWTDVTNLIYIPSASNSSFYFFDYKNWQYWRVSWEYIPQFQNFNWYGWPVKSLNSFVKWPEAWGKK
jgi:hypothetical protein